MTVKEILKENREFAKKHIDRKLTNRLRMFAVVFCALLIFIIYDVLRHDFNPLLIIGGFILGVCVG
jgi:hypothetical protein